MDVMVSTPLAQLVIGCAIEVHSILGPGLLESAYESCLEHELILRGTYLRRQVVLPVTYMGLELVSGFRADFVIEESLLVELKSVERLLPIHEAQVLTYLRLARLKQGLLINFNVLRLTAGLKSFLM